MPIALGLAMFVAGGCGNAQAHPSAPVASAPTPTRWPAETAGGACYLLDYDVVEQAIGVAFDVAASSEANGTYTCVMQAKGASFPDLTLAVTATSADPAVFKATVQPKGASPAAGLGKIGYTAAVPAGPGAGPGVDVGWLSGDGRILLLRYRFAEGTPAAEAGALTPKLVELAARVDRNSQ
jgi:hypothetical protein